MIMLLTKFPMRMFKIMNFLDNLEPRMIRYSRFECIQEMLVKYWLIESTLLSKNRDVTLLEPTNESTESFIKASDFLLNSKPILGEFQIYRKTGLWTKLLLEKLEIDEVFATLILTRIELICEKNQVISGVQFEVYFWRYISNGNEISKMSVLGLGIALLTIYHQTIEPQYKNSIYRFIESFASKGDVASTVSSDQGMNLNFYIQILMEDANLSSTGNLPSPVGSFKPVGKLRLKAIEFLAELSMSINDPLLPCQMSLVRAYQSSKLLETLFGYFSRFPWNNFLHSALTDLFLTLLNDSPLRDFILIDLGILEKILVLDYQQTVGYKGHLMILLEKIHQLETDEIFSPTSCCTWKDAWERKKLFLLNYLDRKSSILGGGARPPTYTPDEEEVDAEGGNFDMDGNSASAGSQADSEDENKEVYTDKEDIIALRGDLYKAEIERPSLLPNQEVLLYPGVIMTDNDWRGQTTSDSQSVTSSDSKDDSDYSSSEDDDIILLVPNTALAPKTLSLYSSSSSSGSDDEEDEDICVSVVKSDTPIPSSKPFLKKENSQLCESPTGSPTSNASGTSLNSLPSNTSAPKMQDPFVKIYDASSVELSLQIEQLARFLTLSMIDKHLPASLQTKLQTPLLNGSQQCHPSNSSEINDLCSASIPSFSEGVQLSPHSPSPSKSVHSNPIYKMSRTQSSSTILTKSSFRRRQSLPVLQFENLNIFEDPLRHIQTVNSMSPPPPPQMPPGGPLGHKRLDSIDKI